MAAHKTTVVEVKELTDETVSYCVRCCDEEQTDSWCTVNIAALSDADVQKTLGEHAHRLIAKHDAKLKWRANHQKQGDEVVPVAPQEAKV